MMIATTVVTNQTMTFDDSGWSSSVWPHCRLCCWNSITSGRNSARRVIIYAPPSRLSISLQLIQLLWLPCKPPIIHRSRMDMPEGHSLGSVGVAPFCLAVCHITHPPTDLTPLHPPTAL